LIESLMYLALGFLGATLPALLIVPALNARAERLARRRVEALFPMSISELTAEKDHLRAEFAIIQRRLERKVDEVQAGKQGVMEQLGERVREVEALTVTLQERTSRVAVLETELKQAQASQASGREELSRVGDQLGTTRAALDRSETALGDLRKAHEANLVDLDAKRISVSDLETRLAMQTSRATDLERWLTERRAELATERQRVAEMAKNVLAEQERGLALEARARTLGSDRNTRAAQLAAAKDELVTLREERDRLAAQLAAARESLSAAERCTKTPRPGWSVSNSAAAARRRTRPNGVGSKSGSRRSRPRKRRWRGRSGVRAKIGPVPRRS